MTTNDDPRSVLSSLRYYDALRDQAALDDAVTIQRHQDSNVDVFLDPQGQEVVLCHLSTFYLFTPVDSHFYEALVATSKAINDLNTGNGTFIPAIQGLNERCPIRFTGEFADADKSVVDGLRNVIEQTSRLPNTADRIPCAFVGAATSDVSITTSLVSGLLGYLQVSGTSTSPELDDKSQYPLFGRTAPMDRGNAIPAISFIDKVFGIDDIAIFNRNDAYGNNYAQAMREAAAVYAPHIKINQIPVDETPEGIAQGVQLVKELGNRYIFLLVIDNDVVLEEAYKQGVAGDGLHTWFGADGFRGPETSRDFDPDDPLFLAFRGSSQIQYSGGVDGEPVFEKFMESLGAINNPTDMDFAVDKLWPDRTDGEVPFANDTTFLNPVSRGFGDFLPLMYEAAVAAGLAACNALTSDNVLTGQAHFDAFKKLSFSAISGQVEFDQETGTRLPQGITYKVTNWVPEERPGGKMGFKHVVSHLLKGSGWDEREAYVFNDGTTIAPADLPPEDESDENDLIIPVVVGALACLLVLVAIIGYLIYDKKKRSNDAIHKVKREDIVFGDPPEVLGRGSFGLVLLGEYRGTQVAVKHLVRASSRRDRTSSSVSRSSISSSSDHSGSNNKSDTDVDDGYYVSMSGRASGILSKSNIPGSSSTSSKQWKAGKQSGILSGRTSTMGSKAMDGSKSRASTKKQRREALMEEMIAEMNTLAKLRHANITTFMGVVMDKDDPMILMEYLEFGSLYDVLHNKTMQIDGEIILPVLRDIVQGVRFLHSAEKPIIHGDLKAANILVDSHFRAKVADFGLTQTEDDVATGTPYWMAPELLHHEGVNSTESDVYSFGVILYEVYSRKEPYENEVFEDILQLVCNPQVKKRPGIPEFMPQQMQSIMCDCLDEEATHRPSFEEINTRLKRITTLGANPTNARSVSARAQQFEETFPPHVAAALKEGHQIEPEHKDMVTILASDIVSFDQMSQHWSEDKVKELLNRFHGKLDELCRKHDIFKVQAIGVSYFAVANLVKDQSQDHCQRVVAFAQDAITAATQTLLDDNDPYLGSVVIRVGIHCGPVIAGVVGNRMPRYTLFGDTINTAMRMESTSDLNRISLSRQAANILGEQDPNAVLEDRGLVRISGKGKMHCYWLGNTNVASDALGRTLARKQNRLISSANNMAVPEHGQAPEQAPPVSSPSIGLASLHEHEEEETGDDPQSAAAEGAESAVADGTEAFDSEYNSPV